MAIRHNLQVVNLLIPILFFAVAVVVGFSLNGRRLRNARALRASELFRQAEKQLRDLQEEKAVLTRQLAARAQVALERTQWEDYQRFVPQIGRLANFMNENFPDDLAMARLRVPPAELLSVCQNLLVELLEARKSKSWTRMRDEIKSREWPDASPVARTESV